MLTFESVVGRLPFDATTPSSLLEVQRGARRAKDGSLEMPPAVQPPAGTADDRGARERVRQLLCGVLLCDEGAREARGAAWEEETATRWWRAAAPALSAGEGAAAGSTSSDAAADRPQLPVEAKRGEEGKEEGTEEDGTEEAAEADAEAQAEAAEAAAWALAEREDLLERAAALWQRSGAAAWQSTFDDAFGPQTDQTQTDGLGATECQRQHRGTAHTVRAAPGPAQ